ncbi:RNA polymerase sigma factor [Dyella monticola]|uniref:RNA polymerase sigma factor n=1 Tax=Dyella monticola TaxID=1927958 RepID=A0A370WTG5_9GAMM|nr:RNA polymerase sigma factor [Dyella monticola]RDS79235.1 RNA polymerase sigma factor [Dyella monticola]
MRVADDAAEARIDQALVTRVLLGNDRRAFEQLLRRHHGTVRAQLRRLLHGDESAADDLAQETFLLAWRKLEQFRGEARFSTWLYRIAYSCFLQAYRKKLPSTDQALDEEVEQLPAPAYEADLRLDLQRAMQRLSTAEQTVLLHCVQLGLSHEETAYVLAMPLGTVKSHATRGKAKLKAWLADWHEAPREEKIV